MALSNWDTFAVDESGQPTNGVFVSPLGVHVDLYKNWLYVRDTKAWEEGSGYVEPTVMQINEGDVHYKDVYIYAKRGPQQGIYCAVYSHSYRDKVEIAMVGCGVYAFEGDDCVGVTPESVAFLQAMLLDDEVYLPRFVSNIRLSGGLRFNQGDGFFADAFGDDVTATKPGAAQAPILLQVLGLDSEKED